MWAFFRNNIRNCTLLHIYCLNDFNYLVYITSVLITYLTPSATALPSCTRLPSAVPCGKHSTAPARGSTVWTSRIEHGGCDESRSWHGAIKNEVPPPENPPLRYMRKVIYECHSPFVEMARCWLKRRSCSVCPAPTSDVPTDQAPSIWGR